MVNDRSLKEMREVESKAGLERLERTRLSLKLKTRQHGTKMDRGHSGELREFMGNYLYFLCEARSNDAC